jgi:hypothetical protein
VSAETSKPEQDKPNMIDNFYFNKLQFTNSRSEFVLKPLVSDRIEEVQTSLQGKQQPKNSE